MSNAINAVQKRFSEGDITVVIGDLNAKLGSARYLQNVCNNKLMVVCVRSHIGHVLSGTDNFDALSPTVWLVTAFFLLVVMVSKSKELNILRISETLFLPMAAGTVPGPSSIPASAVSSGCSSPTQFSMKNYVHLSIPEWWTSGSS